METNCNNSILKILDTKYDEKDLYELSTRLIFGDIEIDQTEMNKLSRGLTERGVHFEDRPLFGGLQIIVYDNDGNEIWDAICHNGSYGHEDGLIEIYGSIVNDDIDDSVEGWLTADEILKRIDEKERK